MRRSVTKRVVFATGAWLVLGIAGGEGRCAVRRTGLPLSGERNAPIPTELASSARAVFAPRQRQGTTVGAAPLIRRTVAVDRNAPIASIPALASGTAADQQRGRTRTLTDRIPRKE